ncbi:MAG TPA: tRNA epoxyqueuosine(34) reductase QueG [Chitinophagales bacterium]|nr:tRNA epoxyqueuosine(34) reductase QueG [Chitinophagales bacterium]
MTKKELIQQWALELGFQQIGFAKAEFLEKEAPLFEQWLKNGFHAEMKYMENWFDKRLDPRLLVEGAQTVMVMTYNYFTPEKQISEDAPKISKYAFGEDYHEVIRAKLNLLIDKIRINYGDIHARGFVDSAPVLERTWAKKAGLGWTGKHSLLINKRKGSFFFIASVIMDLKVEEDSPFVTDHCGSCTKCIDACPTDAIVAPGVVDANKCISYLTIELKDSISDQFKGQMEGWAFGCDICQDVCPWNRFSITHQEPAFQPIDTILEMNMKDWENLSQEAFGKIFKKSPLKRTKWKGIQRNIRFLNDDTNIQ